MYTYSSAGKESACNAGDPSSIPGSGRSAREGIAFQGPELGSCLTLGNELSEETCADKARDFIGKEHPGGEQDGKGTQNSSARWLQSPILW